MRKQSREIALCGLLAALAVVVMVLSAAIGIGTYVGPVLAMAVLLPVLEEYGPRAAFAVYGAAALLGLLLVPEPELALVFAAFGWYPILRPRIARLRSRALRVLLRLVIGVGLILLLYGVVLRLLGLAADLEGIPPLLCAAMVGMGTVTFLLMDAALGRVTLLWRHKLRRRFFRGR